MCKLFEYDYSKFSCFLHKFIVDMFWKNRKMWDYVGLKFNGVNC